MNNYKINTEIIQNKNSAGQQISILTTVGTDGYHDFVNGKKVINISIQAPPGLNFYINENSIPIIIGPNGLFAWEIKKPNIYITSVKIEGNITINPYDTIIITYEYIEE